ncbi:hypothetical protein HispidOSU_028407 [Sigmodon hispidus]
MFLCCLRITQDPEDNTQKSEGHGEGHGSTWRLCFNSWIQCFRRETNLNQGSQSQVLTEQAEKESATKDLNESWRKPHFIRFEEEVDHVLNSLEDREIHVVTEFLGSYQQYVTTQQVLDELFKRYANFCSNSKEDEERKNTICTFLDTWLDKYPQHFCQNSDLSMLKQLKNYLLINMPASDLLVRVLQLQDQWQTEVQTDSEITDEETSEMSVSASDLTVPFDQWSWTSVDEELDDFQSAMESLIPDQEAACALEPECTKPTESSGTCVTLEPNESAAVVSPELSAAVGAVSHHVSRYRAPFPPLASAEGLLPQGKALPPFYPLAVQYITSL